MTLLTGLRMQLQHTHGAFAINLRCPSEIVVVHIHSSDGAWAFQREKCNKIYGFLKDPVASCLQHLSHVSPILCKHSHVSCPLSVSQHAAQQL